MSPVFDEEKYRALIEKLEISEVNIANIDLRDRFDAEYFKQSDLRAMEILKKVRCKTLACLGDFVASAFYPAATQLYEFGDTPFIRCVDCINYPLITNEQNPLFEKIPIDFALKNKGISFLSKGEIVITKVGTPCFASIIHEHEIVALSRTVLGIKNIRDIDPYYLLVYLRTNYGFNQLVRQRELTIQYQLTLDRVKNILIFVPSWNFQQQVRKVIYNANIIKRKAEGLYSASEQSLLQELGLFGWHPPKASMATKTYEDVVTSGRLDAEYFQPKYDELFRRLSKLENVCLGNIVSIKKSIEPGSEAYQDSGLPFIRVSDISKFGITPSSVFLDRSLYYASALTPKKDSILLSKDGSVGIAYKVDRDLDAITSGALLHLTVTDQDFLPDYLTLVLNSIVVKLQAERDAGGSIIQHWKPSEIKNVVIPKMSMDFQRDIASKVQESFALRQESKRLLELAKHAVEVAIEQDEETALTLLEEKQ